MRKILLLCILLCGSLSVFSQQQLTLEEALKITLENNYDIRLRSNLIEIAQNNVSRANAGMLPVVTGNLTTNNSIANSSQTLASGVVQERNGARNGSLNYGVNMNWRIFDGFEMFANYDRLKELQKLSEVDLRAMVQTSLADVIFTYYQLIKQQQDIKAANEALEISRLRLRNAQNRFEIGRAARLEVLAAQVDLNSDTTDVLRQEDLYRVTKIQLNQLMGRDPQTDFTVAGQIEIDGSLTLAQIKSSALTQNPAVQIASINQRIAELNLKAVKANRLPDVNLVSGYAFNNSTSALGFTQQSRGRGFNYGLTASVPIFNGGLQKRNERNAEIRIANARLEQEELALQIESNVSTAYQTYQTSLRLVQLEQSNLAIAKQNLDITLEKFRIGTLAPVEFRQAQQNYVLALTRLTNAQFQAKQAEIALKEISGTISVN